MSKIPSMTSVAAATAPVIWGTTYLVTTEFLPPDRPLLASVLRALPAGLALIWLTRGRVHGQWWAKAAVLGILNIGAFFYFLFVAAYHLPGGVAALVLSVQPMIVVLLGGWLLKQPVRVSHIAACVVVVLGVALLVLTSKAALDAEGIVAGLCGAGCMATGVVLTKKWGRPPTLGNLAFTGWQLTFGGLFLTPIMLAAEGLPASLTVENLVGFSYLGIIGAALSYAMWFKGIERLPASAVSFLSLASPLTATVLGLVFRGEKFTLVQGIGAVAIIASAVLMQPRKPKSPAMPSRLASSESM